MLATSQVDANDHMGDFEITDLMQTVNQNESLASDLLRKTDDLRDGIHHAP